MRMCVCVCIHLPSPRKKTRIRGGGEREEALSLSVRLFLTAAISLIRLWRNRNLVLHRPNLPLPLSRYILLTHSLPPILPLFLHPPPFSPSLPFLLLVCPSASILLCLKAPWKLSGVAPWTNTSTSTHVAAVVHVDELDT